VPVIKKFEIKEWLIY